MGLGRFLLLLTVAIVILLSLTVWFYPLREDFRLGNPYWNGMADVKANYSPATLDSFSALPEKPGGTRLVLIPYMDFATAELDRLESYIREGGTLVLADDYGHGNRVLEHLDIEARFSRQALLDPLLNQGNKWLPRIINVEPDNITGDVGVLVFNHATSLEGTSDNSVIASSSAYSFLDGNGNEERDENEPGGPLAVISRHSLGQGKILLVSDPSIFINSMAPLGDNTAFIENIAAGTGAGLLIDQSHLPPSDLSRAKDVLAQARHLLASPLGLLLMVVAASGLVALPLWKADKSPDAERS